MPVEKGRSIGKEEDIKGPADGEQGRERKEHVRLERLLCGCQTIVIN